MPSPDEMSPVARRAGSVRRPSPTRARGAAGGGAGGGAARSGSGAGGAGTGGAGRARSAGAGRARTTAARSGAPAAARGAGGRPPGGARGKQQRRRRRLKVLAGLVAAAVALLGVFVGVVYASTEVPDPSEIRSEQTTVVYYSDGVTEMARLGDENRTNVPLDQIAEPARNAVLAAENRSFYTDPGISVTGIVRATWNNLTGGSTQGGSTITQQYVKNAILENSEQTFARKFQELFLAIKLDNNFSKDEILENYLNTIYYGRGAYGIESAANTYFGVPASQLTAEQGAVLAVLVRSPSRYDPEVSPEEAQDRWGRVLDGMVEEGWLAGEERAAMTYPAVLPKAGSSLGIPGGPEGLVVAQVKDELRGRYRYSDQQIDAGGLRITSTVEKPAQDAAVAAVTNVMEGEDEILREALVAVDPRTGAVRAYYGGPSGTGMDFATAYRQPGSSMKPYALAAALEQGIGVQARRDGSSPQTFLDREAPVRNSGGVSCGACTLREAMTRSLNTTFYGLAYEVGPQVVAETAREIAGIPDAWTSGQLAGATSLANADGVTGSAIGIGEYEVRPIDQAHGFATFAAGGVERDPYFVARVSDNTGAVLIDNRGEEGDQVIRPEVASDVTYALTDVAAQAKRTLQGGREVAAKTGTQGLNGEDNSDAWMVGYTPSLSTAVWLGTDQRQPIVDSRGRIIYGSGLPGAIWQEFMDTVLAGTPEEELPDSPRIKGDTGEGVPEPTPTPTATAQPTTQAPASTQAPATTTQAPATPSPRTGTTQGPADQDGDVDGTDPDEGSGPDVVPPSQRSGANQPPTTPPPAGGEPAAPATTAPGAPVTG